MKTLTTSRSRSVATIALAALTAGCTLTPDPPALSPQTSEIAVPPAHQTQPYACGVASVEALAAYWDRELPADDHALLDELTTGQQGLRGEDLRGVLERAGLETFVFRGTTDHGPTGLWRQLVDGRPLVVALSSGQGRNHFVLLVGHDPVTDAVIVRDPARGRLVLPGDAFVTSWERADRFTLLAVARDGSAEGRASSAHEAPHAGSAGLPAGTDAPPAGKPLDDDERVTLLAAQRGSDELLELKAGLDLTDREIKLIAGTAIVVVILALIL